MEEKNVLNYKYSDRDSAWGYIFAVLVPLIFQLLGTIILTAIAFSKNLTALELLQIDYVASIYYTLSGASLLLMFVLFNKIRKKKAFSAACINFKFGWVNLIICTLLAVVVLFGFNQFINWLSYLMTLVGYNPDASMPLPLNTPGWLIANLFILAAVPAICEELIYRGIILNGLRKYGTHTAVLCSALIFALAHGSAMQLIYQFILGAVLGYILVKTGSIIASMIVHFLNNAIVIIVNYVSATTGVEIVRTIVDWSAADIIFSICTALASCAAIILLLSFLNPKKANNLYEKTSVRPDNKTLLLFTVAAVIAIIIWCFGTFL